MDEPVADRDVSVSVASRFRRLVQPPMVTVRFRSNDPAETAAIANALRADGWSVHLSPSKGLFRRAPAVVNAVGRPMRGGEAQILANVRAHMELLLTGMRAELLGIQVRQASAAVGREWRVVPVAGPTSPQRQDVVAVSNGLRVFGTRATALGEARAVLEGAGVRGGWELAPLEPPFALLRNRRTLAAIVTASFVSVIGLVLGILFPEWFGFSVGKAVPSDLARYAVVALTIVLLGVGAGLVLRGQPTRRRSIVVAVLLLLMVSLGFAFAAALLTTSSAWWVAPVVVLSVAAIGLIQYLFGPMLMGWLRATRLRVPAGVILGAIGVTAVVVALHLPMALYYLAAGVPALVGTESWGTAILIGGAFVLFIGLALVAFGIALSGWRRRASQLGPRVMVSMVLAVSFTLVASAVLSSSVDNGRLLARGDYGLGWSVGLYAVCVLEPDSEREQGPFWLVGTDGRSSILFDRARDVARSQGQAAADVRPAIVVDTARPLDYVSSDDDCAG